MSAIKRFIEDIGTMVHTGNTDEIEDILTGWRDDEKFNVLIEGIRWNAISAESCDCLAHNLKRYSESEDN